jgi:hypothetical protein
MINFKASKIWLEIIGRFVWQSICRRISLPRDPETFIDHEEYKLIQKNPPPLRFLLYDLNRLLLPLEAEALTSRPRV